MGTYQFHTTLSLHGSDDQSQSVPAHKHKISPKMQYQNQRSTLPGISMLPIWSKANLTIIALLTGCHNHHPNHLNHKVPPCHPSWRLQSAMKSPCRPQFSPIITCGQVDVHWGTPLFAHSPPPGGVWGTPCQDNHPQSVGPSQCWPHHLLQQTSEEWGDHANGHPCHRQSRWEEAQDGSHPLTLQPGEGGAFGYISDPHSVGLPSASHGGDENPHQLSTPPMGPLGSSHQHSHHCRGHPNHPTPTFMATPMPAASAFSKPGHPVQRGDEGKWAKDHPHHHGGT